MTRIYSNLKFLRYADRLDAIANREVVAPVHVRIKPINRCNHGCWYCAYRADQLQLGDGMDLKDRLPEEKMSEIVDDLVAMGVEAVTFSGGGEPLLYKTLPDVVEVLAAGRVRVTTLTNGANLKGRMAVVFAAHGTWVRVPIDAWNVESYVKSRNAKSGEFDRVIANIRDFAARDTDCVLGVSFIVSRENVDHHLEACSLLKGAGIRHVKLAAAVVANDVHDNNLYHREFADRARAEIDRAKAFSDGAFEVVDQCHEVEERFEKDYGICPFAQFLTVIGANVNVYVCQDKAYNEAGLLGSIMDRSFREFWNLDENRERLYGIGPSRDCRYHCVAHAKNQAIMEYLSIDPEHGRFV